MIIDNKKLVKLLEDEKVLLDELKEVTDTIREHTEAIGTIRKENEEKLKQSEDLRAKIASIFIPLALKEKKSYEKFGNPEVIDGKVSVELVDQRPKSMENAVKDLELRIAEGDKAWRTYLANLK